MFTKAHYIKQLFENERLNHEMTNDQKTTIIRILQNIDWDNMKAGGVTYNKIVVDVIHSILDKNKIPYIMELFYKIKRKYSAMATKETLEKEEVISKKRIQEIDWDLIPGQKYRSFIDKIAYESTLVVK